MATNVSFNGNQLQSYNGTNGIIVQDIKHAGKNAKQAVAYALSHSNQSQIPFIEYPNKPILVTGQIVGTSIADCDAQIDTFNGYLTAKSANLDIDYNGSTRRYVATATNIDVDRPGGLAYANFTITFTATQPFGQDTTQTTPTLSPSGTGRTLGSYQDSITFGGNAPFQLPIITVTLTAVTGGTGATIGIGNDATGQQINVTRTWAANDVLVIDCTQNTVTVNGVQTNFTGAFPDFVPGAGTLDYYDNFTTRTFNYSVVYTKMYI